MSEARKKPLSVKAKLAEEVGDGTHATRNLDLERSLLHTCMSQPERLSMASSLLTSSHFADPRHRAIYATAVSLDGKGLKCTSNMVLAEVLKRPNSEIEPEDFKDAVAQINASDYADIETGCRIINDLYVARRLQSISHEVISRCSSGEDIHELVQELRDSVTGIEGASFRDDSLKDIDETVESLPRGFNSIIEPEFIGIPTPFPKLNRMIYGLRPGDITVIGGRPGSGKSTLLGQMAYYAASQGELVLEYNMEMSPESRLRRIMCAQCSIRHDDVMNKELSEHEKERSWRWYKEEATRFLHISNKYGKTPASVRADIIRKKNKYGKVGLVCIDYLQLMSSGKWFAKRHDEITDIMRSLKHISMDEGVHFVIASAFNRDQEKRHGREQKPKNSDLSESGTIEADASNIILPWRPSLTHTGQGRPPGDSLVVGKQRDGRTGDIPVKFVGEFYRFDEDDRDSD